MGRTSRDKRDIYYRLAKASGYRARAAFKLLQLDATLDLFGNSPEAPRVADLCAAPGGWSQVVAERHPGAEIVAVDLKAMAPIPGVRMVLGDITADATAREVVRELGGRADVVLCDGAPDVIGLNDVDEHLQNQLVRKAWAMAAAILSPGGSFVSKIYRGRDATQVLNSLRAHFRSVVCAKPRCSRNASAEAFVVCRGFGDAADDADDDDAPVPFVACGGDDAYDADASFPLDLDPATLGTYEYRDPVQMPINPPHLDGRGGAESPPSPPPSPPPPRDDEVRTRAVSTRAPRDFRYDAAVPLARRDGPPPATDAASLAAWFAPPRADDETVS